MLTPDDILMEAIKEADLMTALDDKNDVLGFLDDLIEEGQDRAAGYTFHGEAEETEDIFGNPLPSAVTFRSKIMETASDPDLKEVDYV